MTRQQTETIPDVVQDTLRAATPEKLLTTFAALTHRMHAADETRDADTAHSLHAQRDLVQAEVLRRMGGE